MTNALKHGALHHEDGTIEVEWILTPTDRETRLNLTWRERGVPRSQAAPQKGFGRTMIEENLPRILEGTVEFAFREDGVECRIDFPLRRPAELSAVI